MSSNHFGPSTPKTGSWQQYSCTADGCKGKRRIPIRPSLAPMRKPLNCEWCGSRQEHRADGGSGCISVIDLTKNPAESPAEIIGKMGAGRRVRTPIPETDDPEGPLVWLSKGDGACSGCDTVFKADTFGENTPLFNILAQMKKATGETYCPDCHQSGGGQ